MLAAVTPFGHPSTIRRGTKQKSGCRKPFAQPAEQSIGHMALRRRRRAPPPQVILVESPGNVVKEQREVHTARFRHLGEAAPQPIEFTAIIEANVQSRAQRINEIELTLSASRHQLFHQRQFRRGIRLAPEGTVFQIVFGRIQVGIQAPGCHPIE
jgi:hypothetical protein